MKPKHQLDVLEALCNSICAEVSTLVSAQAEPDVVFALHLKEANKLNLDGGDKPYLTVVGDTITKQEGKQPIYKKFWHREYPVIGKSLTDMKLQAYHEFLTVAVSIGILSLKNSSVEEIQQVSQPHA